MISGVDRTINYVNNSLGITDELGAKVNTCSFKTYAEDVSGWVPEAGNELEIYDGSDNIIFGGVITKIGEKRVGLTPGTTSELLTYQVDCQDWTRLLQRKLVVETYLNKTCKEIMQLMINKYFPFDEFTLDNFADGPLVAQIAFNYKTGDKALEELAKAVGYQWYVDYNRDIHFFASEDSDVFTTITDATDNWNDLEITPDSTQLRNRIFVRGGIYYSDPFLQSNEADGIQEAFLLAYTPSYDGFSLTIDGTPRTVGIDNVDEAADFDFMLNRKEKTLKMGDTEWATANTPLPAGTIVAATYNYEIPILITQEDSSSITALRAIEGGDGVYEYLISDKNITSISAARERAYAELRDYANPIVKGKYRTHQATGVKAGNLIAINSTRRGLNANYLIQTVRISQITQDQLQYDIQFSGRLYSLVDILIRLFKNSQEVVLGLDEVLDAFNTFSDALDGIEDGTPTFEESAPPFKWSNDAGTTPNKMRWSLFEWS
jgi:hypothetical protein